MKPFATLGRDVSSRGQACGYSPGDTPDTDCKAAATWHMLWNVDMDAGMACDPHMTDARSRFVFVDSHRIGPDCGTPGARWDFPAKRCAHPGQPLVETAAAEQPATV